MKTHFASGNQAMQDAQAIRQQLQTATNDQKPTLLARMKADYQTAIAEYQQALEDTTVRDENGVGEDLFYSPEPLPGLAFDLGHCKVRSAAAPVAVGCSARLIRSTRSTPGREGYTPT